MDFRLTDEEIMLRKMMDFAENRLAPVAEPRARSF